MHSGDPLSPLSVIDLLEVGSPRVEPKRTIIPYRVVQSGSEESAELVFSYPEEVFDPEDPASHNLAALAGAQVAVNYGLFCRQIRFRGRLDAVDQSFIRDAVENTAREIYVNKFLLENPFLRGEAARLPTVKQKEYSRAELVFEPAVKADAFEWTHSTDSVGILSSGGKDSLLTYGLMSELGYDVHPFFGNESGRHWFTALNAYRHFEEHVQNTARVWMTSDRLFSWMLRRLPFVRPNFASVRSDEYPIRLWTVAVFLFAVLPLARKRKVGRILIGDEYDTTVRTSLSGITHYDGLYDQSRYFDDSLCRFFSRKGWGIQQFSILRPLSELLIQKILVERYPELQKLQVSCHAAHKEGDRVRPCGKCEKCRRIVSMLVALGREPSACGYDASQVEHCLKEFTEKGIHQERAGARRLLWLLDEKRAIDLPPKRRSRLNAHPEIESLRFDRQRSPLGSIPKDPRRRLYEIYMQYARGAVRRRDRLWIEFDPLSITSLTEPYGFEPEEAAASEAFDFLLGCMNWIEAGEKFKEVDVALLPVGSIEQHGPHLPLDTDAFDADYLARQVARKCRPPRPIVLPLIPYGVSYSHEDFAGTIGISNQTLSNLVYEIGMAVARFGIRKLVIVNGHGGNDPSLNFAAQMINKDSHIFVCVDTGETSDVDIDTLVETENDVHAGEIETSTSLAVRPERVRMDRAVRAVPRFSSRYLDFSSKRGVSWYGRTQRISESGVLGDPTRATAEKGEKIWELMIEHLVAFVEDLKRLTLDEIYQRRL